MHWPGGRSNGLMERAGREDNTAEAKERRGTRFGPGMGREGPRATCLAGAPAPLSRPPPLLPCWTWIGIYS